MSAEQIPIWVIGTVLLAFGVGALFVPLYPHQFAEIGQALIVAGILSVVVDPLLKARLVKEAARGIFPHLLGFDQQPEIKERLKRLIIDTKLFRRDCDMKCSFVPTPGGMRIDIEYKYELINPTHKTRAFEQRLRVEHAQKPTVSLFAMSEGEKEKYSEQPKIELGGPLWVARGPRVQIEPSSMGIRYRFRAKYSLSFPAEFYWHLNFGYPTIIVDVAIDAPKNLVVTTAVYASEGQGSAIYPRERLDAKGQARYERLFMPGEHLDFRWSYAVSADKSVARSR